MNSQEKRELEIYAAEIRLGIIESTYNAKAGHPGGSLSAADVIAYLYGRQMKYDVKTRRIRIGTDLSSPKAMPLPRFTAPWHIRDSFR